MDAGEEVGLAVGLFASWALGLAVDIYPARHTHVKGQEIVQVAVAMVTGRAKKHELVAARRRW